MEINFLKNMASLVAQMVKHLSTMRETWVQSLGWEDPLEKEMATHSRTIAWKTPWTEEPGRLQSMGSQRVWHNWATSLLKVVFCADGNLLHCFSPAARFYLRCTLRCGWMVLVFSIKFFLSILGSCTSKQLCKCEILSFLLFQSLANWLEGGR